LLIKDGEALSTTPIPRLDRLHQEQDLDAERLWFAVYVSSRHEKVVQTHLELREIESFLPLYHAVRLWRNRCRKDLQLPLFPNYLFVHLQLGKRVDVLRVPGVLSIVNRGTQPAPLPQSIIESLRGALSLRSVEPHPYLIVGHRVRIHSGPLAGLEGVLVKKKDNLRVVLNLDQIMQSAAIEVDGSEVEDIGPPAQMPFCSRGFLDRSSRPAS
jgi:transcription antitermination factor NusG